MSEPDYLKIMSTGRRARAFSRRWWSNQLFKIRLYRWLGGHWVSLMAKLKVPEAKSEKVFVHKQMRFAIFLWEGEREIKYVATGIYLPGTNYELLRHFYCNRIVGVKIWS